MSSPVSDFTAQTFRTVDAMDADGVAAQFAFDGTLTFANQAPLVGPDVIRSANAAFFTLIKGIRHSVINEWNVAADTVIELKVTYDRLDGSSVTIPVVSIWTRRPDGLFSSYRVFYDTTPIFS